MKHVDRYRRALKESDLPPPARWVATCLADYMDHDTLASAFPGNPRLVRETGYGDRTVRRALVVLVDTGWLKVHRQGAGKRATLFQGVVRVTTLSGQSDHQPSHTTGRGRWSAPPFQQIFPAVKKGDFWCPHAAALFEVKNPRALARTLNHPDMGTVPPATNVAYAEKRMAEIVNILNGHDCDG